MSPPAKRADVAPPNGDDAREERDVIAEARADAARYETARVLGEAALVEARLAKHGTQRTGTHVFEALGALTGEVAGMRSSLDRIETAVEQIDTGYGRRFEAIEHAARSSRQQLDSLVDEYEKIEDTGLRERISAARARDLTEVADAKSRLEALEKEKRERAIADAALEQKAKDDETKREARVRRAKDYLSIAVATIAVLSALGGAAVYAWSHFH